MSGTNITPQDKETANEGGMDETITIGEDGTTLPVVELLTGRGFITGKSGSGKSNSASVVAEELLRGGYPIAVVDTDGEYWGLKEEFEVLHVGADEECDLQVGPEHAEKLAELALEDNVPIILDVSGFLDDDEARALIREFAHHLFAKEKKLKKPFLLLVEEVHEYIPEGGGLDETGQMLIKIGKRGRKHGLGIVGISQRPADVKKDFITQCDWLVWHRLTWDNDLKAVRRVLGSDYTDPVQDLNTGEGFLMADWADGISRIQWKRKTTFDAGATPDLGEFERPDLKGVGGDLVGELEEITEQKMREKDRIAQLERRVEELKDEKADLEEELQQARDMSDMAQQFTQALTSSAGGEASDNLQQRIDEIQQEKNAEIRDLRDERDSLKDQVEELQQARNDLRERVEGLEEYEQAAEHMDELREAVVRMNDALGIDSDGKSERLRQKVQKREETIEDLRAQVKRLQESSGPAVEPLEDYDEFLNADAVRSQISQAKEEATCSPRYVKGVLAAILQEGGAVDYDTIAERLGVSTTSDVSKAASELERRKIITKDRRDDGMYVDLNIDGMNEVRRAAAEREKAEELMELL